jgi:hypothetical protein
MERNRQGQYMRCKTVGGAIAIGILLTASFATQVLAVSPPTYVAGSTGVDVSWPTGNCYAAPQFIRSWAIVGVNDGLDFRGNPCLRSEAARFPNASLYVNTGYASSANGHIFPSFPEHCVHSDKECLAYNYGYNAGKYAVTYAASQGVHAAMWWLDVETDNSWSNNILYNRASLEGETAAIQRYTLIGHVGIYSYPGQWVAIMGDWHNGLPNWVATGTDQRSVAIAWCSGQNFTGGPTWLTQYTLKLDQDYVCQTH